MPLNNHYFMSKLTLISVGILDQTHPYSPPTLSTNRIKGKSFSIFLHLSLPRVTILSIQSLLEATTIYNELKWTIFTSDELGLLQMISKSNTEQYFNDDVRFPRYKHRTFNIKIIQIKMIFFSNILISN